jgi:multicomponent Na+:H+ antiporter subunit D
MVNVDTSHWIVLPIAVPLIGALAAFILGGHWSGRVGLVTVLLAAISAGVLTHGVWEHGPHHYALGDWQPPLGIALVADGLTCAMLLMSAVVGLVVSVYAFAYFGAATAHADGRTGDPAVFWSLWLLLWGSLQTIFLARDIFNLYVALELLTLSAVGLVIQAHTRTALAAALRYLLAAFVGSLLYLAGVVLLYGTYGALDIDLLRTLVVAEPTSHAALLLMMVGLMLKTALFPFHFWLPPAHGSAPAPVSAVLSGLVVKGSFYILLRLWFDLFPPDVTHPVALVPTVLGSAAILWGSWQALVAERLKMLVAYSTVAQLGYLFLVFGLARSGAYGAGTAWSAIVLFAVSHAAAKAALFLAAGTIHHVAGHDRIHELAGVSRRLPVTFFAIGAASVSLMGLPPTGSFVAKWTMLRVAISGGHAWLVVFMIGGGLLAAVYLFRVVGTAFAQPGPGTTPSAGAPASGWLEYTALCLALVSLILGLAAAPFDALTDIGSPWQHAAVQEAGP